MEIITANMRNEEAAVFKLRDLYLKYGYLHYKVNKFEEYDFYVRNKAFLESENILTFTDTNGRLMALKPDITLSILKNIKNGESGLTKVFYNENVYRTDRDSGRFREIMQTGLECIGSIDDFCVSEVLMLAAKSLEMISADYILDISGMGFVAGLVDEAGIYGDKRRSLLKLVGEKNVLGIKRLLEEAGISDDITDRLCTAAALYGPIGEALNEMESLVINDSMRASLEELKTLYKLLSLCGMADKLNVDLSLISDDNYYNGVVFKGYINGIPSAVLSGGRYDGLVSKMGKDAGAIGFALYLDLLQRFGENAKEYDVDTLIIYGDDTPAEKVLKVVADEIKNGNTARAEKSDSGDIRYKTLLKI